MLLVLLSVFLFVCLLPERTFLLDWDTSWFLYHAFTAGEIYHPNGTHLLLGWLYSPVVFLSGMPEDLFFNLRWFALVFAIGGLIAYVLLLQELFPSRPALVALLAVFYVVFPSYQSIFRSMDDNLFAYPFLSLSFYFWFRYIKSASLFSLGCAAICVTVSFLFALGFLPFIGPILAAPVFLVGHEIRLRAKHLLLAGIFLLGAAFLLIGIHSVLAFENGFELMTRDYTARHHPDASWEHFFEMARFSWTEPLTGCSNLDCSQAAWLVPGGRFFLHVFCHGWTALQPLHGAIVAALLVPGPADWYSPRVRFFSRALVLLAFAPLGVLVWKKKWRDVMLYAGFLGLLAVPVIFLAYTKSLDIHERFDAFLFVLPFLLYALREELRLLQVGMAVVIVLIGFGLFYFSRTLAFVSPVSEYRTLLLREPKTHYYFSTDEIGTRDCGVWFSAYVAGLNLDTVTGSREAELDARAEAAGLQPWDVEPLKAPLSFSEFRAIVGRGAENIYISPALRQQLSERGVRIH